MSFTRGLLLSALCGSLWAGFPGIAGAQVYEAARQAIDFSPDPTARSPRLLGMGRLSLASDVNNHIDLWDFARNPAGVLETDSVSTLDVWPSTSSATAKGVPLGSARERQSLAGRELRLAYEAWRRRDTTTAYGILGEFGALRSDRPFDETTVLRGRLDEPSVTAVLNGRMPHFQTERMGYALQLSYQSESSIDEYRTFFSNAQGDYLGRRGDLVSPPNFFDPDEYRVSTLGGLAALSYRLAPWMTAALAGWGSSSRIEGENSDVVHDTGTGEDRPYYGLQLDFIGQLGDLQYGVDGRTWNSSSEERFVFTLKAGRNQEPFTSRGKVLDREEDGSEVRSRLRWTSGSLQANLTAETGSRNVDITPTIPGDPESYNYFIDVAANRLGADSLALPDSVRRTHAEDRSWHVGYGLTWKIRGGRGLVGLEYHLARQTADNVVYHSVSTVDLVTGDSIQVYEPSFTGQGPDRRIWDVRGGIEYACTPVLKGRLGYIYRSDDRDEGSNQDEFTSNTLTAGLGLAPLGASWSFDLGWAVQWIAPDFTEGTDLKENRQQMAAQLRWIF